MNRCASHSKRRWSSISPTLRLIQGWPSTIPSAQPMRSFLPSIGHRPRRRSIRLSRSIPNGLRPIIRSPQSSFTTSAIGRRPNALFCAGPNSMQIYRPSAIITAFAWSCMGERPRDWRKCRLPASSIPFSQDCIFTLGGFIFSCASTSERSTNSKERSNFSPPMRWRTNISEMPAPLWAERRKRSYSGVPPSL